jgi:ribosome maturation factor RimP
MAPIDVEKLRKIAEPVVAGQGYELVDVEWARQQGGKIGRAHV